MHMCTICFAYFFFSVLFPHSPSPLPPLLHLPSSLSFLNPQLNERQRAVVARILGAQGRPAPYVVFGPPGTGKTMTVIEGILQVYSLSSGSCRILACAPSNSASDLIVRRERERGREGGRKVRRNGGRNGGREGGRESESERGGKGKTAKQAFVNC